MKSAKRFMTTLLIVALTAFGVAVAQDDQSQNQQDQTQNQTQQQETQTQEQQSQEQQSQEQESEEPATPEEAQEQVEQNQPETTTFEIEGEQVAPLGEIQVGEPQAYENSQTETVEVQVQTGAIIINTVAADGQSPNIDLVGPNGFYEHFEVPTAEGEEHIVEGLLPGVYSLAATDDGLQVSHTLVEVTANQAIPVQIELQVAEGYQEGSFQASENTSYPDNAFEASEPVAIEDAEFGAVEVTSDNEDGRFVVTGPNGYSQEFTGSFSATDLTPGVYVIAGTLPGSYVLEGSLGGAEIATSAVEVNISEAVTYVPVYDVEGAETEEVEAQTEEVQDVAGGGEAEVEGEVQSEPDAEHTETDAAQEQPAEEQPAEEQPAEEQPAEEQPAEEQPAEEQPAEEQPAEEQPEQQQENQSQ